MKRLITNTLFFLIFALPIQAYAAIAFDTATSADGGAGTTLTFSHTNSGNFLAVAGKCASNSLTPSVTYAGTPMTKVGQVSLDINDTTGLFVLFDPATGANNVVVTCSGFSGAISGRAGSYSGVASPLDNTGQTTVTNGTSNTLSITATSSDAWIVGTMRNNAGGWTMTTGTDRIGGGNSNIIADSNGTCSSCTLAGTHPSGDGAIIAVTIAPAAAPPASTDTSIVGLVSATWLY